MEQVTQAVPDEFEPLVPMQILFVTEQRVSTQYRFRISYDQRQDNGLTIRCFVMRFFHLLVEGFEALANPRNCDIITIALKEQLDDCQFTSGKWGVRDLRSRKDG